MRPHREHVIHAFSPNLRQNIDVLEKFQCVAIRHISGMKGLRYKIETKLSFFVIVKKKPFENEYCIAKRFFISDFF